MKIFPVVHINENDVFGAVRESKRAFNSGADGIYLIDRNNGAGDVKPLFNTYYSIVAESPERYVGLNILDLSPYDAMRLLARSLNKSKGLIPAPAALWVNDMRSDAVENPLHKNLAMELKNSNPRLETVRIIGGVAYKNTDFFTDDPDLARYEASWLESAVDVVLTSAATTHREPSFDKLKAMKEVIDKPLAVDGGISINNIRQYSGVVDEALVSRAIETSPGSGKIDQRELEKLIELAHSLAE